ncbi:hypothetical protein [Bacteroides sp.]
MKTLKYLFSSISSPLPTGEGLGERLLFAALLLASCTQGDPLPDSAGEIRLKSTTGAISSTLTRATVNEDFASLTAQVMKTHEQGNYQAGAEGMYAGSMTFVPGEAATFEEAQYYPGDEAKAVYLCGLHPREGWEAPAGTPSTVDRAIDGCTDIMVAPEVASTRLEAAAGTYQTLGFVHVLTHLVVTARAGDDDASDSWGEITKIELAEAGGSTPCNKVSVQPSDGSATYSNEAGTPAAKMYQIGNEVIDPMARSSAEVPFAQVPIPSGDSYKPIAYSLVAPVVAATDADAFVLKVYTEKRPSGYPVAVRLKTAGNTVGKTYVVALTFKVIDIKAQATVAKWEDGETIEKDVILE